MEGEWYEVHEFPVIPIPFGKKAPSVPGWQTPRKWPINLEKTGVGILLGEPSGVVDLDFDSKVARRIAERLVKPGPGIARFGRADSYVSHALIRLVAVDQKSRRWSDPETRTVHVELRSTGSQTLVPPSRHPSGQQLRWVDDWSLLADEAQDCDPEYLGSTIAAAAILAVRWETGNRHALALACAGWLLRSGWDTGRVADFVDAIAYAAGDPDVKDRRDAVIATASRLEERDTTGLPTVVDIVGEKVARVVQQLLLREGGKGGKGKHKGPSLIERLLIAVSDGTLAFIPELGAWAKWSVDGWTVGGPETFVSALLERTSGEEREAAGNSFARLEDIARKWPPLVVPIDRWDPDPEIIATGNCVVNVRTGHVRAEEPLDRCLRRTQIEYDPDARATLFQALLNQAIGSPPTVEWLQMAIGLSTLGMPTKAVFVVHGPTDCGKTTFLDMVRMALGSYAAIASPDFMTVGVGKAEQLAAAVAARRFVVVSEPDRDLIVSPAVLKRMTGAETVVARRLFGHPFEVRTSWSLWIDTNWRPVVPDADDAIWNRLKPVHFKHVVRKRVGDPGYVPRFRDQLRDEASGVLTWLIQGASMALEKWPDLEIPAPDADELREWREDEDVLADFIRTCLEVDELGTVPRKTVWGTYERWTKMRSDVSKRLGRTSFYDEIIQRLGLSIVTIDGERCFRGISIWSDILSDIPVFGLE